MLRSRIPLIACGLGALFLGACSSDAKKSTSTTATSIAGSSTLPGTVPPTATTVAGTPIATLPTTPSVTTASTHTTVASGATSTTVKARVVTSPSDNVKLGDSGDGVKQIQFALKSKGYNVSVDAKFGQQTDAAVKAFQKKNGLKVDGVVGKVTWAKLQAATSTATTVKGSTTTTVKGSTTTTIKK